MKRITLELLYKNTNSNNIDIIVNKLIQTLVSSNDKGFRQSLTDKVFDLAVRFSRSDMWFLRVVRVLILHASEYITTSMVNSILPIFTESWHDTPEFAKELVFTLAEMLETTDGQPSDVLMRLFSWVVGNIAVPYLRNKTPSNFQRSSQPFMSNQKASLPQTENTTDLLDDMLGAPAKPATSTNAPTTNTETNMNQGVDLLDLDFGMGSENPAPPAPVESHNTGSGNMDLLDDLDLLSGPVPANPPQSSQPTDFGLDLLDDPVNNDVMQVNDSAPVGEGLDLLDNAQEASGSSGKEFEDFLVRITVLVLGLFNWVHKSDMTKCWILDALQQIRRILRDIGGFDDFLEEIKTVLQRDAEHSNFEVRLRVKQAIQFDVDIRELGKLKKL
jgi:hypothetical protein